MKWNKTTPSKMGTYLWVQCFGCACIIKSGMAWIHNSSFSYPEAYKHTTKDGIVGILFEGPVKPDFIKGKPVIDYWLKVPSVPRDDEEPRIPILPSTDPPQKYQK